MATSKQPRKLAYRPFADTQLDYLTCNIFGHLWNDVTGTAPLRDVRYIMGDRIVLRCTRCTTARMEVWSPIGRLIYREYRYPAGYRTVINCGQTFTRREFARMELLARRESTKPARTRRRRAS